MDRPEGTPQEQRVAGAAAGRAALGWVASDVHRLHDPHLEVWLGTPRPHVEVPARVESIREALMAEAAWRRVPPTEHGIEPIEAVHDPGLVTYLAGAWEEWTAPLARRSTSR